MDAPEAFDRISNSEHDHVFGPFPFLRMFLRDINGHSGTTAVWEDEGSSVSMSEDSLDYLIVPRLLIPPTQILKCLRKDGNLLVFGRNEGSYLQIRRRPWRIHQNPAILRSTLRSQGFSHQLVFSCDHEMRRLFWGPLVLGRLDLPIFSGRKKVKEWLLTNKYFQRFMPCWGLVASSKPMKDIVLMQLLETVGAICPGAQLLGCSISKTGMAVLMFSNVIARFGITQSGSKRILDNVRNLRSVRARLSKEDLNNVPNVVGSGVVGRWPYCIETRIAGEEPECFVHEPDLKKVMSEEAAAFAFELARKTEDRVKVGREFHDEFIERPLKAIRDSLEDEEPRARLQEIGQIVSAELEGEEIPLVFSHGDFKLENVRWSSSSRKLVGIFDWDLASERSLPCSDLYNLFVSNEILLRDCAYWEAVRKKLFPFRLEGWEKEILWKYFEAFGIAKRLERPLAFMYWVSHILKWMTFYGHCTSREERKSFERETSLLAASIKRELLADSTVALGRP